MISRRGFLTGGVTFVALSAPVLAEDEKSFMTQAFHQKQGRPILSEIHAAWCPICKAQKPILSELTAHMAVLDFDGQKDAVRRFGAQMQSTLVVYKEVGRLLKPNARPLRNS